MKQWNELDPQKQKSAKRLIVIGVIFVIVLLAYIVYIMVR